jgi:hypothetical protein
MRARIGVSAAAIAATIMVAACSGDEDEPSSLPDATSAGSAVTPTDTGSTSPADPTAQLEAEITDFYKLYVETINESYISDLALNRRAGMFVDSCGDCRRGYELAKRVRQEQLVLHGGVVSIASVRVDNATQNNAVFTSLTSSSAGTVFDQAGNVMQTLAESADVQIVYQIERDGRGKWIITDSQVSS